MLDDSLFESRPNGRKTKPFTLIMSTAAHVLMVGSLVVIPLMQIQAMPPAAPPPPVRTAAPHISIVELAPAPAANRAARDTQVPLQTSVIFEPTAIPAKAALIQDDLDASVSDLLKNGLGLNPGLTKFGIPGDGGLPGTIPAVPVLTPPPPTPLPPAPPDPKIPVREPIRVSSTIQKSHLLKQVDPAYPPLAILAHVEGAVILEARITESGTIEGLRLISGNPLLVRSVIDAVKQWQYEPTLLNGNPVEVITTITVNFTLRRALTRNY